MLQFCSTYVRLLCVAFNEASSGGKQLHFSTELETVLSVCKCRGLLQNLQQNASSLNESINAAPAIFFFYNNNVFLVGIVKKNHSGIRKDFL